MEKRIAKLQTLLQEKKCDAIIISKDENRRYLTGFTGSTGLVFFSANGKVRNVYVDFRYIEQAKLQSPHCQVEMVKQNAGYELLKDIIKSLNVKKLAFEGHNVTWETYIQMQDVFSAVELVSVPLDELRLVKDDSELKIIRKAMCIADTALSNILPIIKPGKRESDIALELEYQMRKLGAEKNSFETIVASGKRSSLPHGRASDKFIEENDFVTIDFGAFYEGYASDMTRTLVVGKASEKQKEIYNLVLEAQVAAVEAVAEGQSARTIDLIARDIISSAGYADYFGHGLGHGIGLEVHEGPRLSPMFTDSIIKENMVFSIEPGVYIPDWGGVRIEDLVVAKKNGCEVLTTTTKKLLELN